MKKRIFLTLLLMIVASAMALAQEVDDTDVVKITSKLVQVDVVVTDAKGQQVTDLRADDFTILQDGQPQTITGFSYVPVGRANDRPAETRSDNTVTVPPSRPRSGARGRVITFIVDDGNCRASMVGMKASREAIEKFVTTQMAPDDVVAIYQTRSGSSMFQQYSSDKVQLLRAARRIRWYPAAGGCATSDGSFYDAARINTETINTTQGVKGISEESEDEKRRRELREDRGSDYQVTGSLGVLRYAIRGLDRIPGRKVLFLLSDGIALRARDGRSLGAADKLRDLTDLANRSGVVVNSIDVRGLFDAGMIEARDKISVIDSPLATEGISNIRRRELINTQDGLAFLADETGGKFFKNESYLDVPIGRGLEIEKGYYLVAYEPDDDTFKDKYFNKIEIKLRRPELRVSSRAGFLGVVDQAANKNAKSGDSELYEAIAAPLPSAGMNLRLSASFANTPAGGSFVRAQVHIPGNEVTFAESKGVKKAVFDVVAVTMNEKNEVVDEFTRTHSFTVADAAAFPVIERNGLIYSADVKVTKPGFYNFRVALRDANSKRLGVVNQMVQVPELKPGRIFVSGLSATEADASGKFVVPGPVDPANAFAVAVSPGISGIRQFKRGSVIAYPYDIYNAKRGPDGKPNLTVEVNLYQDDKLLIDGAPQPADLQNQSDWSRINDYGYLKLNPQMPAGDYILQVIVRDLAAGKNAVATQSSDFQIID